MANAHPADGGSDTVNVRTTPNATVTTTDYYKSTTSEHDGRANSAGVAAITFSIGHPTRGYTVTVSVSTSSGEHCSTAFTPQ